MKIKHIIAMIAGCVLPLLLILMAPLMGIRGNWPIFFFVAAMFVCHLLMPMHSHHPSDDKTTKRKINETHSH